jgi:hypothetical protein
MRVFCHSLDRLDVTFDDEHLVANAGLMLPATLAKHLGLRELFDEHVDLGDVAGRANVGHKAMTLVHSAVSDRRVLKLLRQWLQAGVLVDGVVTETVTGTPQGGVISPLLANVYLHAFDRAWQERGTTKSSAMRTTSWCCVQPRNRPKKPSGRPPPYWVTSV